MKNNYESYKEFFENAPDPILMGNLQTKSILDCNKKVCELTGYSKEEIIGQGYVKIIHPESITEIRNISNHLLKFGEISNIKLTLLCKNNEKIYVSFSSKAKLNNQGEYEFNRIFLRDVTSLVEARQEAKKRTKQLASRNYELNTLVYILAHDFKASLRALNNLSKMIALDTNNHLTTTSEEYLDLIKNRSDKTYQLIKSVIDFFRMDRFDEEYEKINFPLFLSDLIECLNKPTQYKIIYSSNVEFINAQKILLREVLFNLIQNSIDHHHNFSEGKTTVTIKEYKKFYKISIEDNGPGIPQEFQQKVFGLFTHLSENKSSNNMGMGLAIVKRIIETIGGEIELFSIKGKGAKFTITWPKEIVKECIASDLLRDVGT